MQCGKSILYINKNKSNTFNEIIFETIRKTAVIVLFILPATCSDGIQNQGESEIDCGGPCSSCGG